MKKKLIYINACMRDESRTLRIATPVMEELSRRYEVETIHLDETDFLPVDREVLHQRNIEYYVPEELVTMAKRIAAADRIVIAAPFWDMSFPSILKVFFENMSLFNITFSSTDKECVGLCKCEKVLYITTRGMDISTGSPLEQATPYIKALSHLWGLGSLSVISAQNLDYSSPEIIDRKISEAIGEGLSLAENW